MKKIRRLDSKDNILHIAMLNAIWPERWKREGNVNSEGRAVEVMAEMRRLFTEQKAARLGLASGATETIAYSDGERFLAMRREEAGPSEAPSPSEAPTVERSVAHPQKPRSGTDPVVGIGASDGTAGPSQEAADASE